MSFQISCDLLKKSLINCAYFKFSRSIYQTHYDVLKLKTDCSSKEIKNSFIKLSKKYHPDVSKNKLSHSKFLKINEAYKVLSRPETRRNYDLGLRNPVTHKVYTTSSSGTRPGADPWMNPIFYPNGDQSKDGYYKSQPYYGIAGVNKVSNAFVISICLFLVSIGVGLQFVAVNKSVSWKRDAMEKRSLEAQETLLQLRQVALSNDKNAQIEMLRKRMAEQSVGGDTK